MTTAGYSCVGGPAAITSFLVTVRRQHCYTSTTSQHIMPVCFSLRNMTFDDCCAKYRNRARITPDHNVFRNMETVSANRSLVGLP